MASISEIRRKNLLYLRKTAEADFYEYEKNKATRYTDITFCDYAGITPSTFSQLKNEKQKPYFNEIYARKIEQRTGLEMGWFDINRDVTDVKNLQIKFAQFRKGLLAYHEFMDTAIISINDDDKRDHMIEQLFLFLYTETDINQAEITDADFFEFMK